MPIWVFAAISTLVSGTMSPATAAGADATRPYVVVYDSGRQGAFPVQAETAKRERAYGFRSDRRFRHTIDGFAARLSADAVRSLRADPDVALVTPDRVLRAARVPLATGETVPTGIARIGAGSPALGVHPPGAAAVAVLDSGIDLSHPDLAAHAGANCVGAGLGAPTDTDGHGTFVAGIIGARNDGAGVVGVAPGTDLYAVKVLGLRGTGLISDIICGVEWVTLHGPGLGIRVANMSLSGPETAEPLRLAIQRSVSRGIVYTVAAGNAGQDVSTEIPGSYPEVITVTAMSDTDGAAGGVGPPSCDVGEVDDAYWSMSNRATHPDDIAHVVAGPGVCVESTAPGGWLQTMTGTSAAAPHVAGVVAVCMGEPARPGPCAEMSPAEVTEQVRADAAAHATPQNGFAGDPFSPVGGHYFGHLVSGLEPTIRRIAPGRAQPEPGPVAASAPSFVDTTLDGLAMRIARRQDVDHLSVAARMAEPGTVTARGRIRFARGAARLFVTHRASARVNPHETRRLRLSLRRSALLRVKAALRGGTRVLARVTMTASDAAGNARSKSRRVRLRP